MRIKVYLGKAERGKIEPELEDDELRSLVPDWDRLEDEDRRAKLQARASDEKIIFDDRETYVSVLRQVAKKMRKRVNIDDDAEVKAFLDEFAGLPESDRRRFGVWRASIIH